MKNKNDTVTVTEKRYGQYQEDDVSVTIRSNGATAGGGIRSVDYLLYQNTVGSLCARDWRGVGNQYVDEGKLIIEIVKDI